MEEQPLYKLCKCRGGTPVGIWPREGGGGTTAHAQQQGKEGQYMQYICNTNIEALEVPSDTW